MDSRDPIPPDSEFVEQPTLVHSSEDALRRSKTSVSQDPGQPPKATLVLPGYEILEELGRGGMGVVHKARHLALNRIVAIKWMRAGYDAHPEERERFRTEAEAVARLSHPNIVQIYEIGSHEGTPYFSLEYCASGTLESALRGRCLPAREAAERVLTLARALHAAHLVGVIHRDLKPANILVRDGTLKVSDFGLAKKLDDVGQTQSGVILGTPTHMAPEQAAGQPHLFGPATDIWALGVILYQTLTGRLPFDGRTGMETVQNVLQTEPIAPRTLQPSIPRDLETICLKCLQKHPPQRYRTANELADDLARFLDDEPILARRPGIVRRLGRAVRRHPVRFVGALFGMLLLATGLWMWQLWQNGRDHRSRAEAAQNTVADLSKAIEAARTVRVQTFANVARRNGVLEGVGELATKQAEQRVQRFRVFRHGEIVERVEVDKGLYQSIPFSPLAYLLEDFDGPVSELAGTWTFRYSYQSDGGLLEETLTDPGKVAWSLRYQSATRATYRRRPGDTQPSKVRSTTVEITRNASGFDQEVRFTDGTWLTLAGTRVDRLHSSYDANGLPVRVEQRAADNTVSCVRSFTFNDRFLESSRASFDGKDRPLVLGAFHKQTWSYNQRGNHETTIGYDADREIRRGIWKYDAKGAVVAFESYRVARAGNRLLVSRTNSLGQPLETRHYDADDKPTLTPDGWHCRKQEYDAAGRNLSGATFGVRLQPVLDTMYNNHRWEYRYENGLRVECRNYDTVGKQIRHRFTGAIQQYKYDEKRRHIETRTLDTDEKPIVGPALPADETWTYDSEGRMIRHDVRIADAAGAFHLLRSEDGNGRLLESRFYSSEGKAIVGDLGYHAIRYTLDEHGNRTATRVFDTKMNPIPPKGDNSSR